MVVFTEERREQTSDFGRTRFGTLKLQPPRQILRALLVGGKRSHARQLRLPPAILARLARLAHFVATIASCNRPAQTAAAI